MNFAARVLFIIFSALLGAASFDETSTENYSETAEITYLPDYNVLVDLKFKFTREFTTEPSSRTNLGHFPALIYALSDEFGLNSAKASFTRGVWDSSKWAKPPHSPSSSGFQFNGHFMKQFGSSHIEERYNRVINLISGYFCASLAVLKYSNAIRPVITTSEQTLELIGIIPGEPVCIENLQPWIELLPSGSKAGLAQMIKPEAIYQTDYHVLEFEFQKQCKDDSCSRFDVTMLLRMVNVYDLNRWSRRGTWSLTSLLGDSYVQKSQMTSPKVILRIPDDPAFLSSLHKKTKHISANMGTLTLTYEEEDLIDSLIGASDIPVQKEHLNQELPFRSFRFKSGSTDDFGGLGIALENFSDDSIIVNLIESIPWYFNLFLHEAQFSLNSVLIPTSEISKHLLEFLIEPAITRKRNLLLQSKWLLPAKSKIQIYFPMEREFLGINEFPQNSERGIELPGAIVSYEYKVNQEYFTFTETSNTLLFTWPLPDATMPFNVITMTATLAALFYGAFFNLIYRKYYFKLPNDPPSGRIPMLIWKVKNKYLNKK